jgi:hypothetical protein
MSTLNKTKIKYSFLAKGIFILSVFAFGFVVTPNHKAEASVSTDSLYTQVNSERSQYGLKPLTVNYKLQAAAQAKANDMAAKGYFAHNSPDGRTPWSFITAAGYSYSAAGENLAEGYDDANYVVTAWMNSPGHRANLLNSNFTEVGYAISSGTYEGRTVTFVVQEFGLPKYQTAVTTVSKPATTATTQTAQPKLSVSSNAITAVKKNTVSPAKKTIIAQAKPLAQNLNAKNQVKGEETSAENIVPAVQTHVSFLERILAFFANIKNLFS